MVRPFKIGYCMYRRLLKMADGWLKIEGYNNNKNGKTKNFLFIFSVFFWGYQLELGAGISIWQAIEVY